MTVKDKQAWFIRCPRRSWLRLEGGDRLRFLQNMTTADVGSLTLGQAVQGVLVNQRGLVLDWVDVWAYEQAVEVLTGPQRADVLAAWLDRYIIADDVTLNQTAQSVMMMGGAALTKDVLPGVRTNDWPEPGTHRVLHLDGVRCRVARVAGVPGDAFWVRVPAAHEARLMAWLLGHGVVQETPERFRFRCLKWGIPGGDALTQLDANPWELRLDAAIAATKGCYLGQEVVTRLKSYDKVQRHLMGFVAPGPLVSGTQLMTPSAERAGQVLVSAPNPDADEAFGLALVRKRFALEGTPLTVENSDTPGPIILVNCPFWH